MPTTVSEPTAASPPSRIRSRMQCRWPGPRRSLREPSSASRGDGARRCQGRDRGKLHDLEFGGGKLEQIANLVTGIGMLGAAAWIATKAMAIVGGEAAIGTPL